MADIITLEQKIMLRKQKKAEWQRNYRANLANDVKAVNNAKTAETNRIRYNSDNTYKETKNEQNKQRAKDTRQKAKLYEESLKTVQVIVNPPTDPYYCKYCDKTYNKNYFQKHLASSKHSTNTKYKTVITNTA